MRSRNQRRKTRVYRVLSRDTTGLFYTSVSWIEYSAVESASHSEGHLSHRRLKLTATNFYALGFRVRHQVGFQFLKVLGFREQLQRSSSGSPDHSKHYSAICLH